jgi:hypothetical protein
LVLRIEYLGMSRGASMRKFAFAVLLSFALPAAALSQQRPATPKAILVEKVIYANPVPEKKLYRVEFQLGAGKMVSYEISPPEALKIADGLSKPATAGSEKQQVATVVYGMNIQPDSKGQALIISPRGRSGPLEALAIPISGADQFVSLLQAKIAEARALSQPKAASPEQPKPAAEQPKPGSEQPKN